MNDETRPTIDMRAPHRDAAIQLSLLDPDSEAVVAPCPKKSARAGAFTDNMKLPVHRWFRYSAGFSAEWAANEIRASGAQRVLDPFAGSGTALLAASECGVCSVGYEAHPFIARVAAAKANVTVRLSAFEQDLSDLLSIAKEVHAAAAYQPEGILAKCYDEATFRKLMSLRTAWETGGFRERDAGELLWLLITSILRECSGVGTAQWQYVLPNKRKARVKEPFVALRDKANLFAHDLQYAQNAYRGVVDIRAHDVRRGIDAEGFDLVITSPPYPNNYDYADATRLEMTFWGELRGWGDLQRAVRKNLIRACSQHSAAERLELQALLSERALKPIIGPLREACETLDAVRLTKGGKKTYHTMVAAYFLDLAHIWAHLRRSIAPGGVVKFVIGDSAPYGIYIPCEKWLGQLALAAGFESFDFKKIRDRNVKWKNRKHRVPLKEGVLEVRA
ncbi:MAG: DNA modification methylase [Amphiplicatus sp.]